MKVNKSNMLLGILIPSFTHHDERTIVTLYILWLEQHRVTLVQYPFRSTKKIASYARECRGGQLNDAGIVVHVFVGKIA